MTVGDPILTWPADAAMIRPRDAAFAAELSREVIRDRRPRIWLFRIEGGPHWSGKIPRAKPRATGHALLGLQTGVRGLIVVVALLRRLVVGLGLLGRASTRRSPPLAGSIPGNPRDRDNAATRELCHSRSDRPR